MSTSGELDVQIVHGVGDISQAAWDGLSAGRAFASHRWYQFGEAVLAQDRPVYLLVCRRGAPVARATFWLTRAVPLPGLRGWQRVLLQAALARRPVLLCRSPLADMSGLILPEGDAGRSCILAEVVRAAREWGKRHAISFIVFDYLTAEEAAPEGWPHGFGAATVPDPGTQLPVRWPDFECYLAHLRSPARKSHRQHCRQAARLGIEARRYSRVPCLDEAVGLVTSVERHYGSPVPWARRALEHAPMVDGAWIAAEQAGLPAAACLFLRDGPAAMLTLLGRDYRIPYAYFQLFYEGIRCAIQAGVGALRGGSGAYEWKDRLGFRAEANNHVAFAAASPLLGWLSRTAGYVGN